jgi:hypothetical protein
MLLLDSFLWQNRRMTEPSPFNSQNRQELPELVPGEDYIMEGTNLVFTSAYHVKRGYCCGSGCRNCPYRNEPEK